MQLPTYSEASKKMLFKETTDYYLLSQQAKEQTPEKLPTPLDEFIYNEEILSQSPNGEFRKGLSKLIEYIEQECEQECEQGYLDDRDSWKYSMEKVLQENFNLTLAIPIVFILGLTIAYQVTTNI